SKEPPGSVKWIEKRGDTENVIVR
ncbi:MAG: hypothetical protein RLZZ214_3855, partial [Verrucomicrobiota bacterium]